MAKTKLKKREWTFIVIGVSVVALAILVPFARKAQAAHKKSEAQLTQAQNRVRDAQELRMIIEAERSGQEAIQGRLEARPANFSLYSFANRCLRENGLEGRAELSTGNSRVPTLESTDLELIGVSMEELVNFLHQLLANDNLIVVQKLDYLRPARDGKGLDCEMALLAPRA